MTIAFIHSRISLKNHIRFQTKMGKFYTVYRLDRRKTIPLGATHACKAYIREYPLGLFPKIGPLDHFQDRALGDTIQNIMILLCLYQRQFFVLSAIYLLLHLRSRRAHDADFNFSFYFSISFFAKR